MGTEHYASGGSAGSEDSEGSDAAGEPSARAAAAGARMGEERLQGLVTISRVLGAARSYDEVIQLSAAAAREAMEAASVSVARWERELGFIRTLVNSGELAEWQEQLPGDELYRLSDYPALVERLESNGGFTFTVDDEGPVQEQEWLRRAGRYSAVVVPIVLEGRTWGWIYATRNRNQPPFTDADLGFATAVAAHIAAGIAQAGHLQQVHRLAYADPLTGLANRRALEERLDVAMDRHRHDGRAVSVILCDLNGLKAVNDLRGHEAGDQLIMELAGLLGTASAALPGGLAARLGGDEFCVLAEGGSPDQVVAVAERICRDAATLAGGYGVSAGVASTADPVGHVDTPRRLLRLADAAQYRAKRSRSTIPVIAGRRLPPETASALPAVPDIEPGVPERRRAFPRSSADPGAVLTAVLAALDSSDVEGVQGRLEVLADTVARRLDAASWWVSHVPPGERVLRSVSWSVYRPGAGPPMEPERTVPDAYDLDAYPLTEAAISGGGYAIVAGAPENDPAEDALLVADGYAGAAAGGVRTAEGGWLVEVFTDEMSARVEGLGPVMRALACIAALPRAS